MAPPPRDRPPGATPGATPTVRADRGARASTSRLPGAAASSTARLPSEVEARLAEADPWQGRYVLLDELGRGGMGVVHRAHDLRLGREVAIKVLGGDGPQNPSGAALVRFEQEALTAARLRHPGIVAIHEVGRAEEDGRPFLVMDLVTGSSLEETLRARPLAPRRVAEIVRDVARACHHAHEHGVVHRDVKPENILIEAGDDGRDHALLTDFGLAREIEGGSRLTVTGEVIGTPAYMAPEQASPDRGATGPATDVYSLGGVLFRAIAGRPPFAGDDILSLLHDLLLIDPPPLRQVNPEAHPDLETIAARCLEKEPARRYPSASALADDLQRFIDGELIHARPVGRVERVSRWARRNRLAAAASAAFAVATIAFAIGGGVLIAATGRRIAADRAAVVEAAAVEAELAWTAFADVRRAAEAEVDDETLGATEIASRRRRRHDELLGLGLRAVQATATHQALARDDDAAERRAFDAMTAYGEVALAAEQWGVAASAFERAGTLEVDPDRARALGKRVEAARERVDRERRAIVLAVLEDARSGTLSARAGGREDALFQLVRLPEAQTVELLATALDEVTGLLRAAIVETWRTAATPDADELRGGELGIDGLSPAIDAWLDGDLVRGELPPDVAAPLEAAAARLERRAARRRGRSGLSGPSRRVPRVEQVVAEEQARSLGAGRVTLARLCCEALGRIGRRERAVVAIARYMRLERDDDRAAAGGIALCLLGGLAAERAVMTTARRFGPASRFWSQVRRYVARMGERTELRAETRDDFVLRGVLRQDKGDLEGAIDDFSRAIDLDPDHAASWNNRGNARIERGDLAGAADDFTRAIELDPGDPSARNNLGLVLFRLGRHEEAEARFTEAIDLDGVDPIYFTNRAALRQTRGDLAGALADCEAAIAADPGNATAFATRGLIHQARGDHDAALADLDRAIDLDPGHPTTWSQRGALRRITGDLDGALRDLDRAIELQPDDPAAWNARGLIRWRRGDHDAAIDDLDAALARDPELLAALRNRAKVRRSAGDLAGAERDFGAALALAPDDASTLYDRGITRFEAGELRGALADLSRVVELRPRDASAWNQRGLVHQRLGVLDASIEDYDRAIELVPDDAGLHSNRGLTRMLAGDRRGAIADFDRAIALDENELVALTNRAMARMEIGDREGALRDHDASVALAPDDPVVRVNRAGTLAILGRFEAALRDLDAVILAAPETPQAYSIRAYVRSGLGDRRAALADLDRYLQLVPDDDAELLNRAAVRLQERDGRGALADATAAIELETEDPQAWGIRGMAKGMLGREAEAIPDLERFLQLAPDHDLAPVVRSHLERLR